MPENRSRYVPSGMASQTVSRQLRMANLLWLIISRYGQNIEIVQRN